VKLAQQMAPTGSAPSSHRTHVSVECMFSDATSSVSQVIPRYDGLQFISSTSYLLCIEISFLVMNCCIAYTVAFLSYELDLLGVISICGCVKNVKVSSLNVYGAILFLFCFCISSLSLLIPADNICSSAPFYLSCPSTSER
jgi:hypothetical protein